MSGAGYSGTREHLRDELIRIDQLVRAQVVRWRLTLAETKPEQLWGMVHVTDREVDAFMQTPFLGFDEVPPELEAVLRPYWDRASAIGHDIARRLEETEPRASRLSRLVARFSLSALDRDVLLLALFPAVDERYRRLYGYLQDDCSRSTATVGLIAQVLQGAARASAVEAALALDGPLRAARLVEVEAPGFRSPAMCGVRADDRIVAFLRELDPIDERLVPFAQLTASPVAPDAPWPSLDPVLDWLGRGEDAESAPVCLLEGPAGGRLAAARSLCQAAGAPALVANVPAAFQSGVEWREIVERVYREAALTCAWPVWRGCDAVTTDADLRILARAAYDSAEGSVLISEAPLRAIGTLFGRRVVRVETPRAASAQREHVWRASLASAPAGSGRLTELAVQLANLYPLSPSQIRAAVVTASAAARGRDPRQPIVTIDDLAAGCRAQTAVQSSGIAERLEPRPELTLGALIVPPDIMSQLDELRRRIAARHAVHSALRLGAGRAGRGVTAMFTGPSGCGKTLAAESLASERRLDLYRVDLSAVVSKYVGETEKNLARVFSEIGDSNGILFFDEADALFGKRGEVVDARDRWANTEVNYLLQTLEGYEGVVILATNLRQNIDNAFTRRIQVVVEFPFPDADARLALWQAALGGVARPPDVELQAVAERFQLTGGSIANVTLDAVFRALSEAADGPEVTVNHLALAIAAEYRRLGKPVTPGEFGTEMYELATARELARLRTTSLDASS